MKKDQFIIAYLPDLDATETVVSHALHMARMLSKGLILLHICDPKYSPLTTGEAEQRLKSLQQTLPSGVTASYAALKGATAQVVDALPTLLGAVVIVAQVVPRARRGSAMGRRAILKNFAGSRAAFLVVQQPLTGASQTADVATVVDFKKESKDKFIWSSYFPRFGGSTMHILYYDYKDEFLRSKWYANMTQLTKLYTELGVSFQPHPIDSGSTYADVNALRYAAAHNIGMLIAVTTKERDGLEFFIGTQEQRTIVNKFRIPILFLNPREDLYVLCD